jgi:uncharacterized protein (TIGR01244 family)
MAKHDRREAWRSGWRRSAVGVLAALGAVAPLARAEIPQTIDGIPNYRVLRPGLAATSGQPAPEAFARLASQGFKTVVNLRTEEEGARHEETWVKDAGLRYVWIPVTPESFTVEDAEALRMVLDDAEAAPMLIHCATGNRVGAVWTVIQVRQGRPLSEARSEGEAIGLRGPMEQAVRRVLRLDDHE